MLAIVPATRCTRRVILLDAADTTAPHVAERLREFFSAMREAVTDDSSERPW
jgi:hypothetical protein